MNLVILDGTTGEVQVSRLLELLTAREDTRVTHFALADIVLAPCAGDFECWVKTPGLCRTQDQAQDIARAMRDAELVVFLSPLVFGGYSSTLKKAVDRLIALIDPFFHERDGLTRHLPRYDVYPPLLCIGLADRPSDEASSTFAALAAGNAVNLLAPSFRSLLISPSEVGWEQAVAEAIAVGLSGAPGDRQPISPHDALARVCAPDTLGSDPTPPRTATVLIGSARPKGTSTSESLARGLIGGLELAGVKTTLVHAIGFVKDGRLADSALAAMLDSELLIVASPLYVDALPSLATRALERLSERLRSQPHRLRSVVGLLNCGFPEATHNRTALRMLRSFAHEAGLAWAGGLAMGAGEILHGMPLAKAPLRMRAQIRALELAAGDLAAGHGISRQASDAMARPLLPAFLFRWLAPIRWVLQAGTHGVSWRKLHARPFDKAVSNSGTKASSP